MSQIETYWKGVEFRELCIDRKITVLAHAQDFWLALSKVNFERDEISEVKRNQNYRLCNDRHLTFNIMALTPVYARVRVSDGVVQYCVRVMFLL